MAGIKFHEYLFLQVFNFVIFFYSREKREI